MSRTVFFLALSAFLFSTAAQAHIDLAPRHRLAPPSLAQQLVSRLPAASLGKRDFLPDENQFDKAAISGLETFPIEPLVRSRAKRGTQPSATAALSSLAHLAMQRSLPWQPEWNRLEGAAQKLEQSLHFQLEALLESCRGKLAEIEPDLMTFSDRWAWSGKGSANASPSSLSFDSNIIIVSLPADPPGAESGQTADKAIAYWDYYASCNYWEVDFAPLRSLIAKHQPNAVSNRATTAATKQTGVGPILPWVAKATYWAYRQLELDRLTRKDMVDLLVPIQPVTR